MMPSLILTELVLQAQRRYDDEVAIYQRLLDDYEPHHPEAVGARTRLRAYRRQVEGSYRVLLDAREQLALETAAIITARLLAQQ
jgi:hypothetical protein